MNCPNCGASLRDAVRIDVAIVLDGAEGSEDETEERGEAESVVWDCPDCGYREKREA